MTLTNWLTVIIGLVGVVLTIVVPLVAYLNGVIHRTRNELSDHKTHVAETYATKTDFKDLTARMERQLKDGFETLEKLLNKSKD